MVHGGQRSVAANRGEHPNQLWPNQRPNCVSNQFVRQLGGIRSRATMESHLYFKLCLCQCSPQSCRNKNTAVQHFVENLPHYIDKPNHCNKPSSPLNGKYKDHFQMIKTPIFLPKCKNQCFPKLGNIVEHRSHNFCYDKIVWG